MFILLCVCALMLSVDISSLLIKPTNMSSFLFVYFIFNNLYLNFGKSNGLTLPFECLCIQVLQADFIS